MTKEKSAFDESSISRFLAERVEETVFYLETEDGEISLVSGEPKPNENDLLVVLASSFTAKTVIYLVERLRRLRSFSASFDEYKKEVTKLLRLAKRAVDLMELFGSRPLMIIRMLERITAELESEVCRSPKAVKVNSWRYAAAFLEIICVPAATGLVHADFVALVRNVLLTTVEDGRFAYETVGEVLPIDLIQAAGLTDFRAPSFLERSASQDFRLFFHSCREALMTGRGKPLDAFSRMLKKTQAAGCSIPLDELEILKHKWLEEAEAKILFCASKHQVDFSKCVALERTLVLSGRSLQPERIFSKALSRLRRVYSLEEEAEARLQKLYQDETAAMISNWEASGGSLEKAPALVKLAHREMQSFVVQG